METNILLVFGPAHVKMAANAGLCGAVERSTLLASRLPILRLTSRNPHGMGTSSPSASVFCAAPLAREGGGGSGIWKRAGAAVTREAEEKSFIFEI
jgi:hypothetical protein